MEARKDLDLIEMFQTFSNALEYFNALHQTRCRYESRYYLSATPYRQHQILSALEKYFGNQTSTEPEDKRSPFEEIEANLANLSVSPRNPRGPSESSLVGAIIQRLLYTRKFLLSSMTNEQCLAAARQAHHSSKFTAIILRGEKEKAIGQELLTYILEYRHKTMQLKTDWEAELAKLEYGENINLNKFEAKANQQTRDAIEARINCEWMMCDSILSKMTAVMNKAGTKLDGWKERVEALQKIVQRKLKHGVLKIKLEFAVDRMDELHMFVNPKATMISTKGPSGGTLNTNDKKQSSDCRVKLTHQTEEFRPNPAALDVYTVPSMLSMSSFNTLQSIKSNAAIRINLPKYDSNNFPPPKTPGSPDSFVTCDTSQDIDTLSIADSYLTCKTSQNEQPRFEDSYIFVSKYPYEFHIIKGSKPVVSVPCMKNGEERRLSNDPFAGLDMYAQSLYSGISNVKV